LLALVAMAETQQAVESQAQQAITAQVVLD
jgi:hypothetical protein